VGERVGPVRACSVVCLLASGVIEVSTVRLREPAADAGFGHDQLSDRAGLMVRSEFPGGRVAVLGGCLRSGACVGALRRRRAMVGLYHKVFAVIVS
jgi:hypothetical protein